MFWKLRIRPGEDERNVYAEANEYGIICGPQDLQGIVESLDKYIKKTKVRGAGLQKYIGRSHLLKDNKWKTPTQGGKLYPRKGKKIIF